MRIVEDALYFNPTSCVLLYPGEVTVDTLRSSIEQAYLKSPVFYDVAYDLLDCYAEETKAINEIVSAFQTTYHIMAGNIIGTILCHTLTVQEPVPNIDLSIVAKYIAIKDMLSPLRKLYDGLYFCEDFIREGLQRPVPTDTDSISAVICGRKYIIPTMGPINFGECLCVGLAQDGLLNESQRLVLISNYLKRKED